MTEITDDGTEALQIRLRDATVPELREIISGAWTDSVTRTLARRELESRLRFAAAAKAAERGK
jgi:hypothetical protein